MLSYISVRKLLILLLLVRRTQFLKNHLYVITFLRHLIHKAQSFTLSFKQYLRFSALIIHQCAREGVPFQMLLIDAMGMPDQNGI